VLTLAGWRRGRATAVAIVACLTVLVTVTAPAVALGAESQVKLVLQPVGQPGPYFDLAIPAGESRRLEVRIANDGTAATAARTYAADVYTIVNGGFGGRLRGEPQTGTTRWLDYATDVVQLAPGAATHVTFTVAVPAGTGPGEYITSLVLENDQPVAGAAGTVALDQVMRQAIAVVVTVPGTRSPGLSIGEAIHTVVDGRSTVSVAVENTGNTRLKPTGTFILRDAAGAQISKASVPMDTVYARTPTSIEVPLAALLVPGRYTVRLTLEDAAQDVKVEKDGIAFEVVAQSLGSPGIGAVPGLTGVDQNSPGGVPLLDWAVALVMALSMAFVVTLVAVARRRSGVASV
jgi:hypothetical protein